jgi:drug/metabolite transporter (DMT)-like permease
MTRAPKGILYAVLTSVLWGILAIALKVSLTGLTPADITWFRFLLAFLSLTVYYYLKKPEYLRILRRPPLLLIFASICLAINYFGFIKGVELTSPSVAQIFIQLGPVLFAVSGVVFFHESITYRQMTGLFIVLFGLIIFYNEQIHMVVTDFSLWQRGILWVLIAAITWVVYSVLLKILVLKYPPMQLNLVVFGLPVILYFPFINFSHFLNLGIIGWAILIFLGLNTLFAYGLLTMAIRYTEANKVSVILILNPVLTFALMAIISNTDADWIKHEHYSLLTVLGAITVLAGAILTVIRKSKQPKSIH